MLTTYKTPQGSYWPGSLERNKINTHRHSFPSNTGCYHKRMAMKPLDRKPERSLEISDIPMEPYFPTFHVDGETMPEINKWKTGEDYTITVKVRMSSFSKNETIKGTNSHACIEMLAYEVSKD